MTVWRPQQHIQVKALGLVWRDGKLLASEIYRDDGQIKGVRPLGGRVEFGETWKNTLTREFKEELDVDIAITGAPIVLENIYIHHGMSGHEVVFLVPVALPDGAFEGQSKIIYHEDNGQECCARWFDLANLDCGGLDLYPNGLKEALT